MSRPMNMLRTRRKDCNVKPNRRDYRAARLDRKSSRGMIYENEELRLKTININAEVESRVSDIKKLKKENEMLKKGLWYLRDEYDKLEKLIKDKKLDFSSSSTTGSTSSDSESYSSYSEEGEEVETTQNMQNVQRTNLKNLQDQFDHLSAVTEETSAENSELHSNRDSINKENWTNSENILKPDQSYPEFRCLAKSPTLPMSDNVPVNFFSPIQKTNSGEIIENNTIIYPGDYYNNEQFSGSVLDPNVINNERNLENFISKKTVTTNTTNFYQNMVLVPTNPEVEVQSLEKTAADLIVKIDNQNFNDNTLVFSNTPTQSTFSNGGNLEELLNDIESISQEILKISNLQKAARTSNNQYGYREGFDLPRDETNKEQDDKAYKSELSVVLVPNPMPLIGFDKYKNVQRSFENLTMKPSDDISTPHILVPQQPPFQIDGSHVLVTPTTIPEISHLPLENQEVETNPFFFGNFKDNYVNSDHFSMRYNPDLYKNEDFTHQEINKKANGDNSAKNENVSNKERLQKFGSKSNLLEITSSEHVSSENEETLKGKKVKVTNSEEKKTESKPEKLQNNAKSPKLSIRKKVSIHFKGKKERNKLSYGSDSSLSKTPSERKSSVFDVRFNEKDNKDKPKVIHQKTPSIETQKSVNENLELKTPSSSDSKTSNEKKSEKKDAGVEKKLRKSVSISPDRKHVHVKEDGQQPKKHKKSKKSERSRQRKQSTVEQRMLRERSFSICTDRSNILEHKVGIGAAFGSNLYFDEYSDRERTNSLSSCDTTENRRKLSTLPNVTLSGKVPWCGCWGNGCL